MVGLVEVDEAGGERLAGLGEPRAEAGEAQALAAQVLLDPRELGALAIEARLQPHLAALERRDLALQRR